MPEFLRALVVILFLATAVFAVARAPACAEAMAESDFRWRRNCWLLLTLGAFLAQDFWRFMAVATLLLLPSARRDPNPLALFFFLLFALPPLSREISGFGLARQFFELSYPRLLSLAILLPAALALFARPASEKAGWSAPDRLLAGYLGLNLALQFSVDSPTNTLRHGFYHLLDIILPYYVASRALQERRHFRDALMSFSLAALVLAAIGVFEFGKKWLLYASLDNLLDTDWAYGAYLGRGDSLRALATTGQPIALGFVMAVAGGLFLALRPAVPNRNAWRLGLCLLFLGLLAPLSRGPWLGAAIGALVFIATGPRPLESLMRLGLAGLIALPLLLVSPLGEALLEHLPFVGSLDNESVVYRQQLLELSLGIIRQHPFFGSFDFLRYLEDLRQGQGIIDIVNTYLGVTLGSGLVGLSLFGAFFLAIGLRLYRLLKTRPDLDEEWRHLGRCLLATQAAVVVIIFTVSSITVIPIVYWSVAGLGLAWIRRQEQAAPAPAAPIPVPSPMAHQAAWP